MWPLFCWGVATVCRGVATVLPGCGHGLPGCGHGLPGCGHCFARVWSRFAGVWPLFCQGVVTVCRGVATVLLGCGHGLPGCGHCFAGVWPRFAGVRPLLSLTAFLEPEVRVECWVKTSVPAHSKGWCCGVYKGTPFPHTPRTSQGMLLWGLQRYYLSPHTPRDAAVGFTKVLLLPTHPKGCCCGVYKGTTSPHTPQGMLLWGLQRNSLSPHTPYTPDA